MHDLLPLETARSQLGAESMVSLQWVQFEQQSLEIGIDGEWMDIKQKRYNRLIMANMTYSIWRNMAGKNILDMLSLGRFFPIETGNFTLTSWFFFEGELLTTHNSTLIKSDETMIFPSFFPSFSIIFPTSSAMFHNFSITFPSCFHHFSSCLHHFPSFCPLQAPFLAPKVSSRRQNPGSEFGAPSFRLFGFQLQLLTAELRVDLWYVWHINMIIMYMYILWLYESMSLWVYVMIWVVNHLLMVVCWWWIVDGTLQNPAANFFPIIELL